MSRNPLNPLRPELRIALSYGLFAMFWSVFADKLLLVLFGQSGLENLAIILDIVFGFISSGLIYFFVLRSRRTQDQLASRELEHLNEFQRLVGGSVEYAIFGLDADGLVRSWDADAARMYGFTSHQVLNKPVAQCFVSQETWNPEDLFRQAQLTGRASHLGWLTRSDGYRYWGEVIFEKISLQVGQVTYLVVTRNLSGSRGSERFKSMIESMTEGLIVIDRNWRFAFINTNGAKLLERDASSIIGHNIWQEFPNALDTDFGRACQRAMDQNISSVIDDPSSTSARWLENRIYPNPDGILIFYADVTERHKIQEAIRSSERLYRTISENSHDVILIVGLDSMIQYVSPAAKNILGYEPQELEQTQAFSYIHPDDLERYQINRRKSIEKGDSVFRSENRTRRHDGSYVWTESVVKVIRDEAGNARELQITLRDISEKVVAQEKLEVSERLYRAITENSYDVTFITNLDTTILYVSPSVKMFSGYEPEEMMLTPIINYLHPDDFQKHMASRREALEKGLNMFRSESRLRRKDGEYIWIESILKINRNEHGEVQELQVSSRDITERILAQEKLEESERLYRTLTENAQDVIIVTSPDSKIHFISPSATIVFGYDKSQIDKVFGMDFIHPDDLNGYLNIRQEALENRSEYINSSFRVRHQNGHYIWVESVSKLIRDSDTGVLTEIQSTVRDISERVTALKKLEESERLYRTITENAQDVIIVSTTDRQIRYVSPSASNVLGYSPDEIATVLSLNVTHPDDQASYAAIRQDAVEKHKTHFSATIRIRHQNGNYVWIETLSKLIYDPQTKELREIQSTMRDVTSRKNAQEALERLNAELEQRVQDRTKRLNEVNLELESFTSSVSHDLRSPLNAIQGFGRAFLEDYQTSTPPEGQDFVNRIVGAAGRMDILITDLLQYSRLSKAEIRLTPIALEPLLGDLIHDFEDERERRNATIHLKGHFSTVLARETVLRQIIVNLLGNSLKFSSVGIRPEITIWAETDPQTKTVKLHIQDNGIGIDSQNLERIFQPFERLHGISEYPGSGIGLAFVKRGVERMGGQIGVTSIPGKGSHFWLSLNQPRETS